METPQDELARLKQSIPGWRRISNPAARGMARRLRKMCGRSVNPDDPWYTFPFGMPVDSLYRRWLREALREQQFFTKLDSGMGGLPDIREAVLPIQRPIEELYYPRSMKAMPPHLVRNLEWYLDPIRRPKLPSLVRVYGWIILFNLALGILNLSVSNTNLHVGQLSIPLGAINLACAVLVCFYGICCAGEARGSEKYRMNAAELYRYLVELHTSDKELQENSPQSTSED